MDRENETWAQDGNNKACNNASMDKGCNSLNKEDKAENKAWKLKSWDVRLLSCSYSEEGKDVVIELYGKTRENKSITVRYNKFKPYFHMVAPPAWIRQSLQNNPEILKVEDISLYVDGTMKNALKVTTTIPANVKKYREKFKDECRIMASDILFYRRFLFDYDINSCVRVLGLEDEEHKQNYTTELVVNAEEFKVCEPFKPHLKILSFDIENSIEKGNILTICCQIRNRAVSENMHSYKFAGSEDEIIKNFEGLIIREDPDVITGYNIDNYDIPFIIRRAKKLNIKRLQFGRDRTEPKPTKDGGWNFTGRIIADAWWNAKRQLHPKKETLNYLSKLVLNEGKLDVDPKKIDLEWSNNKEKVIEYCAKDAELALRILEHIAVLEKGMDLATVSKLPLDDVINGHTSQMIDSILIRDADRMHIGVPTMMYDRDTEQIEGGYVHSVQPGLYHWVCVLDFRSMYPSVIITNNICFTTLSKDGEIVSPNGVRFLSKEKKEGLIPRILENLMKDRLEAKNKMKNAKTEEERNYYNGLQEAIKVLMNSFYGVLASSFYRFTNPNIGASITAFARANIKGVIETLEKEGHDVIYSDTDSVFVKSPEDNLEGSLNFGREVSERFSNKGIVLEFDKVLEPFFSHGKKKRYIGKVVWPKEDMLVRGYETRRTDSFDLQAEVLSKVFEKVLSDDIDGAIKVARDAIRDTLAGQVPVEKLVISRTSKDERAYVSPDKQANVIVAKKMKEMGYEFVPGMKVSWIVTNAKTKPQQVEPYIDGREFTHKPDVNYYAKRLALSISRITEVFGWDEEKLLSGICQKSILCDEYKSENMFEKDEKDENKVNDADAKPKTLHKNASHKNVRLDDFF